MTPLQQSPAFARALTAYGADLRSDAPVVMQRRFGPLGRIDFASRVRPDDLRHCPRLINSEVEDAKALRALGYRQIITPMNIAEWDLTADLLAGMQPKWRNCLRKGISEGLHIRETTWDGSPHWLFTEAAAQGRARKYRSFPAALLSAFARENPDGALLFEASTGTTPLAACLVLRHGSTATYQTAWSSPQGLARNAPRVLLSHAAHRLKTLGHHRFDLGPVETDHARGLARFKLGTGATLRRLGGTWLRMP